MNTLSENLQNFSKKFETAIDNALGEGQFGTEILRPEHLLEAMRYSSLDGGKRLRPFLVAQCASLFGIAFEKSIDAAVAIEMIHCYSLVHDDLPAMDDDALRRGRPTTHIKYDEATAILTGDALLTLAFAKIASSEAITDPRIKVELISLLSDAAGVGGMVGGQALDLKAETETFSIEKILRMQSMKTGALIKCACEMGAVLGSASSEKRTALIEYGQLIGQAFQLSDDILDVTSNSETMGKNTGKDAAAGKGTLVEELGLEAAKEKAISLKEMALKTLKSFGEEADTIRQLASFIVDRKF